MPSFAYTGRTRSGEVVSGRNAPPTHGKRRGRPAPRAVGHHAHRAGQGEGRRGREGDPQQEEGEGQNLAIFTRQFLRHDRRRAAARAVLEILGSRRRTRTSPPSSCRPAPTSKAARPWPTPCGSTPARSTRSTPTWWRRRGGRHPRRDPQAPAVYIEKNVKLVSQVKSP